MFALFAVLKYYCQKSLELNLVPFSKQAGLHCSRIRFRSELWTIFQIFLWFSSFHTDSCQDGAIIGCIASFHIPLNS